MNLSALEQKEPWYLKLNPNGRIPTLVDRARDNFAVFETAAILLYLQEHYDKDNKFGWDSKENPEEFSQTLQWLFFVNSGVGPMQGQLGHFTWAPVDIPYAKQRYFDETKRLYGVLESRLSQDRDWLVGPGRGKYTIADINGMGWVRSAPRLGIDFNEFPNVKKWHDAVTSRPGFNAGVNVGNT
jgi:glutathione S-transferase